MVGVTDAPPRAPVSRHRPGADFDRPVHDPLVCARLHLRHPARLAVRPRHHPQRTAVGRSSADQRHRLRRLRALGHARHHPRRPARLRAVLQSGALRGAPAGDLAALAGRHVVPRRLRRLRRRSDGVRLEARHLHPVAGRRGVRGGADRPAARPARQLHQRRAVGPRQRRAVGDGVSRRRRRCRATRASSTRRRSKARCCSRCSPSWCAPARSSGRG